jgi:hypothetical protein
MSSIMVRGRAEKMGEYREHSLYPTPPEPVEKFIEAEKPYLWRHFQVRGARVWEPACGFGAMCEVFRTFGIISVASDLVDRGYPGTLQCDFLADSLPAVACGLPIITNPPFKHAEAFLRRAFATGAPYVAMLLKSNYFHTQSRAAGLWAEHTPDREYPVGWRVDFTGGGSNHFDVSWWVWDRISFHPALRKAGACIRMPALLKSGDK